MWSSPPREFPDSHTVLEGAGRAEVEQDTIAHMLPHLNISGQVRISHKMNYLIQLIRSWAREHSHGRAPLTLFTRGHGRAGSLAHWQDQAEDGQGALPAKQGSESSN